MDNIGDIWEGGHVKKGPIGKGNSKDDLASIKRRILERKALNLLNDRRKAREAEMVKQEKLLLKRFEDWKVFLNNQVDFSNPKQIAIAWSKQSGKNFVDCMDFWKDFLGENTNEKILCLKTRLIYLDCRLSSCNVDYVARNLNKYCKKSMVDDVLGKKSNLAGVYAAFAELWYVVDKSSGHYRKFKDVSQRSNHFRFFRMLSCVGFIKKKQKAKSYL